MENKKAKFDKVQFSKLQGKVDYRKEAIPIEEARQFKMIGKIVVVRNPIQAIVWDIKRPQVHEVWGDIGITLFVNSKWHQAISDQLAQYEGDYTFNGNLNGRYVYLKGQIYFNAFLHHRDVKGNLQREGFLQIKPVNGVKFIVGDDEQCF
jgi:hypothetical protein